MKIIKHQEKDMLISYYSRLKDSPVRIVDTLTNRLNEATPSSTLLSSNRQEAKTSAIEQALVKQRIGDCKQNIAVIAARVKRLADFCRSSLFLVCKQFRQESDRLQHILNDLGCIDPFESLPTQPVAVYHHFYPPPVLIQHHHKIRDVLKSLPPSAYSSTISQMSQSQDIKVDDLVLILEWLRSLRRSLVDLQSRCKLNDQIEQRVFKTIINSLL